MGPFSNEHPETQGRLSIFRLRFGEEWGAMETCDWTKGHDLMVID